MRGPAAILVAVALLLLLGACGRKSANPSRTTTPEAKELTEVFEAPQRCVVIRYPSDWTLNDYAGFPPDHPSRCPGFQHAETKIAADCADPATAYEINSAGGTGVISVDGPAPGPGHDDDAFVALKKLRLRCPTIEEQLRLIAGVHDSPRFFSTTIAGVEAPCFEQAYVTVGQHRHVRRCLVLVGRELFQVAAGGPDTVWFDSVPTTDAIQASIEIHPLP